MKKKSRMPASIQPIYDALKRWNVNAVVNGEIIVANDRGLSDFSVLQTWRSEADGELIYYLFDLAEKKFPGMHR